MAAENLSGDHPEPVDDAARQLRRLNAAGYLRDDTLPALEAVANQFAIAITPRMLDVIDPQSPDILYELVEGGAYAQVTASSLTGGFGSSTRRTAEMMAKCFAKDRQ